MQHQAHEDKPTATASVRLQHPSDASELRWYWEQGGLAVFRTSTFGAALERAAMIAFGGAACQKCAGTGFVPSNPKAWRQASEKERELLALVGLGTKELARPLADRVCGECRGMGWMPRTKRHNSRRPVDVQLTGSSKKGRTSGLELTESSVARLGGISRRLALIAFDEVDVLEGYYSPSGRSIVALYRFTPAGKTLLRRNSQGLPPKQFFENEIARREMKREPQRDDLLDVAEQQAAAKHHDAVGSWILSKRRVDEERTRKAAFALLDGDS